MVRHKNRGQPAAGTVLPSGARCRVCKLATRTTSAEPGDRLRDVRESRL